MCLGPGETPDTRPHLHDDLMTEYDRLAGIVAAFKPAPDDVKNRGCDALARRPGLGFQQDHYGLFLVAAAGGLGLLADQGSRSRRSRSGTPPRMGDIEVAALTLYSLDTPDVVASAPLID